MVALQAMGVAEDSPLRNPKQIPYPTTPPIQSQAGAVDEEDTPSIKELVQVINNHVKIVDLEVTSNLNTVENAQVQQPPADSPTEDVPEW